GQAADEPGPQHELLADDVGLGWCFSEGGDRVLGKAHGLGFSAKRLGILAKMPSIAGRLRGSPEERLRAARRLRASWYHPPQCNPTPPHPRAEASPSCPTC